MTATLTGPPDSIDTDSSVLDMLRESHQIVKSELADQLLAIARWADLHPGVGDTTPLAHDERPGGDGTPSVAAFTAEPLAHALGLTPREAQALLADTLDLRFRLPRTWEQVHALLVPVKKARKIAQLTRDLPAEGAQWVDRQLLGRAASLGMTALDRLVQTAVARFDPQALRSAEAQAHDAWDVTVTHPRKWRGTSVLTAVGDTRAILELQDAIQGRADALPATDDTAGQRRFHALAGLGQEAPATASPGPRRPLRLYAHLDLNDLATHEQREAVGVVEGLGPVTLSTIKTWCAGAPVTVVPVLDLADRSFSPRHDPPPRMAEQVMLRDERCVYPHCTTPARAADLDHIDPWHPHRKPPEGTTPENLAPLCRRHHRAKTLGTWSYERLPDGGYLWQGPHGQITLVTAEGTVTLTE